MKDSINILIQQEIDGTNTPEESEELRLILDRDEDARAIYHQFKQLNTNLSELKFSGNVPDIISTNVMKSISHKADSSTKVKGILSGNKVAGLFAAAAILLIIALFAYNLPQPEITQVTGTIGLNGETQERYSITGDATGKSLTAKSEAFQELLQNSAFIYLMESSELQEAARNKQITRLLGSSEFIKLGSDPQFIRIVSNTDYIPLLETLDITGIPDDSGFSSLFKMPEFQTLIVAYDLPLVMNKTEFNSLIVNKHFTELLRGSTITELMHSAEFWQVIENTDVSLNNLN
jgi:cell fate (sporulation/competence/biofilm development) regulator YlbF (YheA/YmcA/DUF963 family)